MYMHVCTSVCKHICMYTYTYVCKHSICTYSMQTCTYVHNVHMYVCTYACMYLRMQVCLYVASYVHIY